MSGVTSEIENATGEDSETFKKFYDVTENGNWEGKNILNRLNNEPTDQATENILLNERKILLSHRKTRIAPALDDKVLTDWNGYLIRALSEAGIALENKSWISLAEKAFHFISESIGNNEELVHSWREGISVKPALLTDYASMMNAALSLHEATGEDSYLRKVDSWMNILKNGLQRWWWRILPDIEN